MAKKKHLSWSERVVMLSIHPDAASREDIARLASELMLSNARMMRERDKRLADNCPTERINGK